ncbi:Hypothetical predicted protein, partial [Mytilus galloprovincialis]
IHPSVNCTRYGAQTNFNFRRGPRFAAGQPNNSSQRGSSANPRAAVRFQRPPFHGPKPLVLHSYTSVENYVTRYQFNAVLKKALNVANITSDNFQSHSFRIGAASQSSKMGFSDDEIQDFGRWESKAYKRYIRIPTLKKSVDGINLGLERIKSTIWWQGKSGMRICEIIPKVKHLLTLEEPPQVLVFHCGGNDIGQKVSCVLGHDILKVIDCLRVLLPKSKFVWSQILPRLKYRNEIVHRSLNRTRVRLNSLVATYIIKHGGAYIRYPELSEDNPDLFLDGVHLSDIGNNLFLYRLQQGLFDIIKFSHTICL